MWSSLILPFLASGTTSLSGVQGASSLAIPEISKQVVNAQKSSTTGVGSTNALGEQASKTGNSLNSLQGAMSMSDPTSWFGTLSGFNKADEARKNKVAKYLGKLWG